MSLCEVTEKLCCPSVKNLNGYTVMAHGTGLCDECSAIFVPEKSAKHGYDTIMPAGTVMSIEAFVGRRSGGEGVKLEQQIVVREHGLELLPNYALDLI